MANIEEMELVLLCNSNYDSYNRLASSLDNYDPLRYMMAISNSANESGASEKIAFIGGLGVLGNLVRIVGNKAIFQWREFHDVDLLLKDRIYEVAIKSVFDNIDVYEPSKSIRNKLTLRGKSTDSEKRTLESVAVDIYHPNGNPRNGINVAGLRIDSEFWDRSLTTPFYGIPVRFLDPIDILNLKLKIICGNDGHPRTKDIQDIYHLLSVADSIGYDPRKVKDKISKTYSCQSLDDISSLLDAEEFIPIIKLDSKYKNKALK